VWHLTSFHIASVSPTRTLPRLPWHTVDKKPCPVHCASLRPFSSCTSCRQLRLLAHLSGDARLQQLLRTAGPAGDVFCTIAAAWLRNNTCARKRRIQPAVLNVGSVYALPGVQHHCKEGCIMVEHGSHHRLLHRIYTLATRGRFVASCCPASCAGGPEAISKQERQRAKGVVYSVVYGRGAAGLAQQLGVPQPDAQRLITSFLHTFPRVGDVQPACGIEGFRVWDTV
jgi:DNA polymerase family A